MNKIWVYLCLILVQVLFGFNFVASKIIVSQVSPTYWGMLRFLTCGVGMLVVVYILYKKKYKFQWSYWGKISLFAFLAFTVGQIAFLKGLKLTTTSNTAIITSLIPLFTLVIVIAIGQERLTWGKSFGFLFAFAGVILLRNIEDFNLCNETFVGDLLILLCAFSTGLFIAFSKKFLQTHNYWWVSTWMFLMGGIQISLFAVYEGDFTFPAVVEPKLMFAMGYALIGATFLTYCLTNWALVHIESAKVAIFIYLQPVVASFSAWLFLDEAITLRNIISCSMVIFGFVLVLISSKGKREMETPPIDPT